MQDYVIRPVKESDLPRVLEIARQTGPGFNSLPNNAGVIEKKIHLSIDSFTEKVEIKKRFYLFVMENLKSREVVGTAGIKACVGMPCPFYKFKLINLVLFSPSLNQSNKYRFLHLANDHENATELDALYLKSTYRGEGRGVFMSRSRLLFIAEFTDFFSDRIVADMRGVSNEKGVSPFWEVVGKNFFGMSYEKASYLKATEGSQFVIDLIPHYPIYVDLLPEEAQKSIGVTHQNTVPAYSTLIKERLQFKEYVDIFDGGPLIEGLKSEIWSVKESQKLLLVSCKAKLQQKELRLISNTQKDFRAILGKIELTEDGGAIMEEDAARALNVTANDYVRFSTFKHG